MTSKLLKKNDVYEVEYGPIDDNGDIKVEKITTITERKNRRRSRASDLAPTRYHCNLDKSRRAKTTRKTMWRSLSHTNT